MGPRKAAKLARLAVSAACMKSRARRFIVDAWSLSCITSLTRLRSASASRCRLAHCRCTASSREITRSSLRHPSGPGGLHPSNLHSSQIGRRHCVQKKANFSVEWRGQNKADAFRSTISNFSSLRARSVCFFFFPLLCVTGENAGECNNN